MALDKRNVESILKLTPTQEGILFHYLYSQNPHQYFEQTCLYLEGALDQDVFEQGWQHVTDRNDMLRTCFAWEKIKKPVQVVLKKMVFNCEYHDLSHLEDEAQTAKIEEIKGRDKAAGFDLTAVPFRIKVLKLSNNSHLSIISSYSILYDGWSFNIILKEFFETYNELAQGGEPIEASKLQFKDYLRVLDTQTNEGEKEYWRKYLTGFEPKELALKRKDTKEDKGLGIKTLEINQGISQAIETKGRDHGFSPSSFFYGIWGVLLQKVSGDKDVAFGATFSGRSLPFKGIEEIAGNFLNTLPIRVVAKSDQPMDQLLVEITEDIRHKQSYERSTLTDIRKFAQLEGQGELFNTLLIFENYPVQQKSLKEGAVLRIADVTFEHSSNYDITLFIVAGSDGYHVHFAYNKEVFDDQAIEMYATWFGNLINKVANDLSISVGKLCLLSASDKREILTFSDGPQVEYRRDITLKYLLEEVAEEFESRVAVACGDERITYHALHKRANELAWLLRGQLGEGKHYIGILADRTVEMITSVLAVIKAGYAYVPIDPTLPNKRINMIINNLSLQVALTTHTFEEKGESLLAEPVTLQTLFSVGEQISMMERKAVGEWQTQIQLRADVLPETDTPDGIAYVIFTSGSTGTPKGVAEQHIPVVNTIDWVNKAVEMNAGVKVLCVASLGFDLSVYDIFGTLSGGGMIQVATYADLGNPDQLTSLLVNEQVNVWNSAPPVLQNVMQWCEAHHEPVLSRGLRHVLLSGDWIGLNLPKQVTRYFEGACVLSLGGATEATIWSNYFPVEEVNPEWSSIPYGKPIQNCSYYILDSDLNPCPIGIIGDLYIGGEGLAAGYINDLTLTAKKFIPSPFRKGERIYDTGDMARWYSDGNIELIGRKDNQVKIRGFRIELGEIESHLKNIPSVDQALAIVNTKSNGEKYICAYYLSEKDQDVNRMRKVLASELPAYMVPAHLLRIDELPLTANGKLDRKRLPKPDEEIGKSPVNQANSALQMELIKIWSEVLDIPQASIGVDANFFELGGHSLNITEVSSRIAKKYNVSIQLRSIYSATEIESLAELVARSILSAQENIPLAPVSEVYDLSPAQMRIYALHESNPNSVLYNIFGGAKIEGELDKQRLTDCLLEVVREQEVFQSSIELLNGRVVQRVHDELELEIVQLSTEGRRIAEVISAFNQPFDLTKAPLIRTAIVVDEAMKHYILIDMHHIISDGYSLKKMIEKVGARYAGADTPKPTVQYKDYVAWVHSRRYMDALESQKKFWKKKFANKVERLNLPIDFQRTQDRSIAGEKVYFSIESDSFQQIKALATASKTTLYITLLAIFKLYLTKLCNQQEIVIGTPVLGRNHKDLEDTTGMFVNTVPIRSDLSGIETLTGLVSRVKEEVEQAFSHDDVPFDWMVQTFDPQNEGTQNPIFDVFYEYDNLALYDFELDGLKVEVMSDLVKRSKFDLTFEVIEYQNRLACRFEYRTDLFKKETIEWMAQKFTKVLEESLQDQGSLVAIDIYADEMAASMSEEELGFSFE